MAVKHYVDEIPPASGRTYRIEVNGDNSKIVDTTQYQQNGTGFGANDVNCACVLECNYSKSGTVHRLTTENTASENIKFFATAAYSRGDTFTFNGTAVTAQTTDGQALDTNFFKANTVVDCFKRGNVLYFASSSTITQGSGGTSLGTFGEGLNHAQRVSYGSNNYKESAIRQFLNSSAAANGFWTPQTKFDRPPSWMTSVAGFASGLDDDFLATVGTVVLPCSANNTYEAPDSTIAKNSKYTLNDKFYLASQREIFGSTTDTVADDSVLLPYYEGATNTDRIKYRDGTAAHWWMRTPISWTAFLVRLVGSDGSLDYIHAHAAFSLAPACTIV